MEKQVLYYIISMYAPVLMRQSLSQLTENQYYSIDKELDRNGKIFYTFDTR